ncbi:MAG: hypothetical protein QOK28_3663 [Actinomycetota bacterium]
MAAPAFAFMIGSGRCGSSLLHEVLARHPGIGFLSNIEDNLTVPVSAGRINSALYRRVPARFTQKGRARFAPSEGYRALDREVSPVISAPVRDLTAADVTPWLADRFRAFFAERATAQDADVFLHKFTGWPRAAFIHAVMPEARFVHVVRDGRAVASSLLQMDWWKGYGGPEAWGFGPLPADDAAAWEASGKSFALLAGIEWKLLLDASEVAKRAVPEKQWLEVRYEDVVIDPVDGFRRILEFLGLEWNESFAVGFARHAFDPAALTRWQADLDLRSIELLNASLADHLARYGYSV